MARMKLALCAIVAVLAASGCKFHFDDIDLDASAGGTPRQLDVTVTGHGAVTGDGGIACVDHCTYTVAGAIDLAAQPVQAWQIASFTPCSGAPATCTIAADVTAVTVDFTQAPITANRVFIVDGTSIVSGRGSLDTACNDAATAASIPGTYVAFVSTTAQNAIDRLAGSRGWVRGDGLPILDQPSDLGSTQLVHAIAFDASGIYVSPADSIATGTQSDGTLASAANCTDWTSVNGSIFADSITTSDATELDLVSSSSTSCPATDAILCFETGKVQPVDVLPPPFPVGRYVFSTNQSVAAIAGPEGFDQECVTEAAAAGLPGTYAAMVATTTTTIRTTCRLACRSVAPPRRRPRDVR